jgi:hypothetical protein
LLPGGSHSIIQNKNDVLVDLFKSMEISKRGEKVWEIGVGYPFLMFILSILTNSEVLGTDIDETFSQLVLIAKEYSKNIQVSSVVTTASVQQTPAVTTASVQQTPAVAHPVTTSSITHPVTTASGPQTSTISSNPVIPKNTIAPVLSKKRKHVIDDDDDDDDNDNSNKENVILNIMPQDDFLTQDDLDFINKAEAEYFEKLNKS